MATAPCLHMGKCGNKDKKKHSHIFSHKVLKTRIVQPLIRSANSWDFKKLIKTWCFQCSQIELSRTAGFNLDDRLLMAETISKHPERHCFYRDLVHVWEAFKTYSPWGECQHRFIATSAHSEMWKHFKSTGTK